MLLMVWFKLKRSPAPEPTSTRGFGFVVRPEWFWRQLRAAPAYRLLYSYNFILGVTCGFALLSGKLVGPTWLGSHAPSIQHSLLNVLLVYIQDVLLANAILVGAIVVRGPPSPATLDIMTELAQRLDPDGRGSMDILPLHGALLIARATIIGPLLMLTGLVLGERRLGHFTELVAIACLLLAAIATIGAIVGIAAVYVRCKVRRHAIWVWFGLWLVPEMSRWMVPGVATPRTIIERTIALASCRWGYQ